MNLEKIRIILEASISDEIKNQLILAHIAEDGNAIKDVLFMLDSERHKRKELLIDMNLELSRAQVFIEDGKRAHGDTIAERKEFIVNSINLFYSKWKDMVQNTFKPKVG